MREMLSGSGLSREDSGGAIGDTAIFGVDASGDVIFEFFNPASEFCTVFVSEVAFDEVLEEAGSAIFGEFGFLCAAEAFLRVGVNESAEKPDECFAELEFFERQHAWEAVEDVVFREDLVIKVETGEWSGAGEHFNEHVSEAGEV